MQNLNPEAHLKHPQERERLSLLHELNILDSDPDPRLDTVTRLAAEILNVPIALVSLVDESRQWFKSRIGLEAEQTPREGSFCSHAILQDDVFEVTNAAEDKRFSDNPLVTSDPNIRFYAGAQITGENHLPLGTLCAIDQKPRKLDDTQRRLLSMLAKLASQLIDPAAHLPSASPRVSKVELLSAGSFIKQMEKFLEENGPDLANYGLGIVQLGGLKRLRRTRGYEFCERACSAAIDVLAKLAPEAPVVARIGFNQFCLLAKRYDAILAGNLNAQKLEAALHTPLFVDGEEIDIQAHLLWVEALQSLTEPEEFPNLIAELSSSPGHMKPGSRLTIYGNELFSSIKQKDSVLKHLNNALEKGDIYFAFQPKVEAQSMRLTGFEALMRWHHPELGMVPPDQIIDAALELGIEQRLLAYTISSVFSRMAQWQEQNILSDKTIALNITADELSSPLFPTLLQNMLEQFDIPGSAIEIELLENGIVDNLERCVENIEASRLLGVSFAIDDFGTGYSSLSYLHKIPADTLKIDKSFVDLIEHNQTSAGMVNAIITLARATGMKTVAEGVENQIQAITLRAYQCNYLQGYFFDKPLSANDAEALLSSDKSYTL